MRRASLKTVIVLIAFTLITAMTEIAQAQVGCCMKRQTPDSSTPWVQVGTDFRECQRLNNDEDDNDNVFEQKGRIWWSLKC